jgi:Rrf2 family iron-sulfur cluster assembly transcriptional regulator
MRAISARWILEPHMRLSSKGRYAVMAMADLARHSDDPGVRAVALADIARRQDLSLAYLEQLFTRLRREGLVVSHRGPGGGYRLARTADLLAVADIITAVDEPLEAVRCKSKSTGCMPGGERCLTHDLWEALGDQIHSFLAGVSLDDVIHGRLRPDKAA